MSGRAIVRVLVLSALFVLLVLTAQALAHMMPQQQGTLNVLGNGVFTVLSLPLSAIQGVDDNGDGRLSYAELATHQADIRREVMQRVRLTDRGRAGRVDFLQLNTEDDERHAASTVGSTHFLVLMKLSFDAPPTALRLETDLWGRAAEEQQLTIRAKRGPDAELM